MYNLRNMKKEIKTYLAIVVLYLISYSLTAQTIQEKQQIISESNTTALKELAISLRIADSLNKAKALELAAQKGWIVRQETNGTLIELQGVRENGKPLYYITHNSDAAESISTYEVHSGGAAGLALDGTGMTIGEWDGGDVHATHQEFNNTGSSRVTDKDGDGSDSWHATHVAGTLIAGGIDADAKGMAFNASLDAYDWNSDDSEMSSAASAGLLISNHSYGYISGWYWNGSSWVWYGDENISTEEDYRFGFYGNTAQAWDQIAVNAPYYLIVKSAGNDRGDGAGEPDHPQDGGADGYDCIGWHGNAKNILTIGATLDVPGGYSGNPADVGMTSFSSWGPSDDGRIKPDISGNGYILYSTYNSGNSAYANSSGTSMSAPNVAGSLLLLQEHYNETNNAYMKSATLKALAIHTADEAGPNDGPDYMFGWGLMNTQTAAEVISNDGVSSLIQEETLSDGNTFSQDIAVPGTDPLIVTIVWTDPAGTPVSAQLDPTDPMLVNDLDLSISNGASKQTWQPYMLDGQNPANAATTGDNDVDNVEKIVVASPSAGTYTIQITHEGSLDGGSQDFSLIVSGIDDAVKPSLSTSSTSNITSNSATSGGNVSFDGDATVDAKGICWSTSPSPTLNDSFTNDGSGEGAFVSSITGLSPNTQYYVRAYATNWVGTSYGDEETFTTDFGSLTWSGDTDSDWNSVSNWNESTAPTEDYNVSIPAVATNDPVIQNGDDVSVNQLTISSEASLSVNGSLTHNGILKIESDISGTGSLIVSGTITSNGSVEAGRYINNDNSWHFLSSPVSGQDIQPGFVPNGSPNLATDFDFYSYDETATNGLPWVNIRSADGSLNDSFETQFSAGKGYLVAYTDNYTTDKTFTGSLTTASQDVSLTYTGSGAQGWNLIGNPYSASIDWNTVDKTPLSDNNFYVYDNTANGGAGDYVYHNGTAGTTSQNISPGQGFFVKVSQTGTLNLSNANLVHSSQNFLKEDKPDNRLELLLSGETDFFDETMVVLNPEASFEKDRYDAAKLFSFNAQSPGIFTFTRDNKKAALDNIPEINESTAMRIGVLIPEKGTYEISMGESSQEFIDHGIFLKDFYNQKVTDFTDQDTYIFNSEKGEIADRFILYLNKSLLGEEEIPAKEKVRIFTDGELINIEIPENESQASVQIYNSTGQLIQSEEFTGTFHSIHIRGLGLYIVKVQTEQTSHKEKIIIK